MEFLSAECHSADGILTNVIILSVVLDKCRSAEDYHHPKDLLC
jgi:hypothetical protein